MASAHDATPAEKALAKVRRLLATVPDSSPQSIAYLANIDTTLVLGYLSGRRTMSPRTAEKLQAVTKARLIACGPVTGTDGVRKILARVLAAGWTPQQIAEATQTTTEHIEALTREKARVRLIRVELRDRIYAAAERSLHGVPGWLDARPLTNLLRAMTAHGWPAELLADFTTIPLLIIEDLLAGEAEQVDPRRVTPDQADHVLMLARCFQSIGRTPAENARRHGFGELADRLEGIVCGLEGPNEKLAARARRRRGWLPLAAYDQDGFPEKLTARERAEVMEDQATEMLKVLRYSLPPYCHSAPVIAARLGVAERRVKTIREQVGLRLWWDRSVDSLVVSRGSAEVAERIRVALRRWDCAPPPAAAEIAHSLGLKVDGYQPPAAGAEQEQHRPAA